MLPITFLATATAVGVSLVMYAFSTKPADTTGRKPHHLPVWTLGLLTAPIAVWTLMSAPGGGLEGIPEALTGWGLLTCVSIPSLAYASIAEVLLRRERNVATTTHEDATT